MDSDNLRDHRVQLRGEGTDELRVCLTENRRQIVCLCQRRFRRIFDVAAQHSEIFVISAGHPQCLRLAQQSRGEIRSQFQSLVEICKGRGVIIDRKLMLGKRGQHIRR